jgi:hypothetical protein
VIDNELHMTVLEPPTTTDWPAIQNILEHWQSIKDDSPELSQQLLIVINKSCCKPIQSGKPRILISAKQYSNIEGSSRRFHSDNDADYAKNHNFSSNLERKSEYLIFLPKSSLARYDIPYDIVVNVVIRVSVESGRIGPESN